MVKLVKRFAEQLYNSLSPNLKRQAGDEEMKIRYNTPTHQQQIYDKRDEEEQKRLRKKAKISWNNVKTNLMQGTGGKRKGTKRKGSKRKGTKRKGTKRKGTKCRGTKRKGTKRRGSKYKIN